MTCLIVSTDAVAAVPSTALGTAWLLTPGSMLTPGLTSQICNAVRAVSVGVAFSDGLELGRARGFVLLAVAPPRILSARIGGGPRDCRSRSTGSETAVLAFGRCCWLGEPEFGFEVAPLRIRPIEGGGNGDGTGSCCKKDCIPLLNLISELLSRQCLGDSLGDAAVSSFSRLSDSIRVEPAVSSSSRGFFGDPKSHLRRSAIRSRFRAEGPNRAEGGGSRRSLPSA